MLHHTRLQQNAPVEKCSFLIDAGAEYNGYAADLTRTYSFRSNNDFAALIKDLNSEQLELIDTIQCGVRYTEYHLQMHHRLAKILRTHKLLVEISEEAILALGLTRPFLPHGLGHFLGLQVHDVGGFIQDDIGTCLAAPSEYPYLRCTRIIQPRMVLTIEPGLYFIDSLLSVWRSGEFSKYFNWQKINMLKSYGGMRIEDNIIIHKKRVENMTRDLGLI